MEASISPECQWLMALWTEFGAKSPFNVKKATQCVDFKRLMIGHRLKKKSTMTTHTLVFFWKAHTASVLIFLLGCLIYILFQVSFYSDSNMNSIFT